MFKNKNLLITGGTGSFGNAVLKRFLNSDVNEIRVLSRDEKKQNDMRTVPNSGLHGNSPASPVAGESVSEVHGEGGIF